MTDQRKQNNMNAMFKLNAKNCENQSPMEFAMGPSRGEINDGSHKFCVGDLVEVGAAYSYQYAVVVGTCDECDFDGKTQLETGSWDYNRNTRHGGAVEWVKDQYLRKLPDV